MTNGVNGIGASGAAAPLRSNKALMVDKSGAPKPQAALAGQPPAVASELRGIVREISAKPPVDVSKVERLAGMIAGGSYKVDAARLADAMISSELPGLKKG